MGHIGPFVGWLVLSRAGDSEEGELLDSRRPVAHSIDRPASASVPLAGFARRTTVEAVQ